MTEPRTVLLYPHDGHDAPDDLNALGLQTDLNTLSRAVLGAVGAMTLLMGRSAFAQTVIRVALGDAA